MPTRTTKSVSAIFAGFFAAVLSADLLPGAARAADDCLSGPKDQTPPGGHWYYRIDHATKRHCWYLRDERETPAQIVQPNSSVSAKPIAPKTEAAMQHSIADARAELPAQTNRDDAPNPALPAKAAGMDNGQGTDAPDTNLRLSVVASRWPEQSGVVFAAAPRPSTSNLAANAPSNPVDAAPSAVAAVPLTAAASSSQIWPASIPTLWVAIAGALALAGIMAGAIFKFAGAQRPRQARVHRHRGAIWESTDDDRIRLSVHPDADAPPRRTGFARDLDRADDRNERVAEFFAQLSRRAPT